MASKEFERAVELATGVPVDVLRSTPIDERRNSLEEASGGTLRFRSYFPFVGRGNVMKDRVVSHEQVETEFQRAVHGEQEA